MSNTAAQDWNKYWQGQAGQMSGEALYGVGIDQNATLKAHWAKVFDGLPPATSIVDIACGAGAVLKHAQEAGINALTGIDISEGAIQSLTARHPSIKGIVCPVNAIDLPDNEFDMAVSQFGFEYAGGPKDVLAAAREIARIVKPNGRIHLISHIKGGVIDQECQQSLDKAKLVEDSGFFTQSRKVINLLTKVKNPRKTPDIDAEVAKMNTTAKPILDWLGQEKEQKNQFYNFVYYLLESTHKLLINHAKYTPEDCTAWFDGMELELQSYAGRMSSMTRAALGEDDVGAILQIFSREGFTGTDQQKMSLKPNSPAGAWILSAKSG